MVQLHRMNGKEMITAIVAAYDIYARLDEAVNPFIYRERGFVATGVCGAVAAAAMVAKIKGGDSDLIGKATGRMYREAAADKGPGIQEGFA